MHKDSDEIIYDLSFSHGLILLMNTVRPHYRNAVIYLGQKKLVILPILRLIYVLCNLISVNGYLRSPQFHKHAIGYPD